MEGSEAADMAAHLARVMENVKDAALQVGWVRTQLEELGAAQATDVLTVVLARAEERNGRYVNLLLRVSLALSAPASSGLRRAIAGLADVREQHALARFLAHEPLDGPDGPEPDAPEPARTKAKTPDFGRGRPLTLGERKSLARRRDRSLLARVLRDPHPDVIHILLDNPALVEDDVVRLCALRPVSPEALAQVFVHPRWILRYRVKHALSRNPHTPEWIALQLVPHLTPQHRRELGHASHVSERLRGACLREETTRRPLH